MRRLGFNLIILGAPVSGKDTQAELLKNHYELKAVKSGEYLRKMMKQVKNKKTFEKTYNKGLPAPTKIILDFIKSNVESAPKSKNLLFVGTPRLKNEAVLLTKLLKKKNQDFLAIFIRLPDKEIYHRSFNRNREIKDQDRDYIKNRISYHKKAVMETVRYFQKMGKLRFINGSQSVLKVARDIQQAINDYKKTK